MTTAERTELGRCGRELVEKHFDRRDVVEQTVMIVKSVLRERSRTIKS